MTLNDPPPGPPENGDSDAALYQRGLAYARLGRWGRAAALLRRLVRRQPDLLAARLRYGEVLLRLGKPAAADEEASAALRLEPDSPEAHRLHGVALARLRRFAEAAEAFRGWIAIAPREAAAEFSLARALLLARDEAGAEAACQRAAAHDRNLVRAHLLMARIALAYGKLGQAQAHLKDAVGARPRAASLRAMLARVLLRRSRLQGALKMARTALAIDPGCDSAALVIAELHIVDGKFAEAQAILRQLGERRPDWVELRALERELAEAGASARREPPPLIEPAPEDAEEATEDWRAADGQQGWGADRPGGFSPGATAGAAAITMPPLYAENDFLDQVFLLRALILRQLRLHYRETSFGFLLEYLRPTIVMILHYILFTALKKPMPSKIPIELFIIGSFTTWFCAVHVLRGTSNSARDSSGMPGVTDLHLAIARTVWEFLSMLSFALLCVVLLKLFGRPEPIPNLPKLVLYFALAATIGLGFGLILKALGRVFAAMETVRKNILWILYVTSGHYFSIAEGRHGLAPYVWWNPLLHISELTRQALFPGYPTAFVAPWYPAVMAAGLVLTGLMLDKWALNRVRG
jgi:capsular polysaccharide transport system permease protein